MSAYAPAVLDRTDIALCRSMQLEEWEVLESIYPDCCISSDISKGFVKLEILVELGDSKRVVITDDGTVTALLPSSYFHDVSSSGSDSPQEPSLKLSSLPPLLLHVNLPPGYPMYAPPEIISVQATHAWLPRPHDLHEMLLDAWQSGEGVLYNWIDWIRHGEFLSTLEMTTDAGDIVRIPHPAPRLLLPLLIAHDENAKLSQFSQNSYTCSVCLSSYKGARCLQLTCSHIFCRGCLEDYWGLCITEGDINRVTCPDPACVKECREGTEEEVARVVSEENVKRWKWLRQKRAIERDPSVIHCPLEFCQAPVPPPKSDEDDESGWARLRTCPSCEHAFCAFCRRTWHGPLSDCPISFTESFILEYISLPEASSARKEIERRYGRGNVLKLVAKYQEEQSNKKWLKESTMACPGCRVHVEKSLGCNHMTCAKCKQHFCYRCGAKISASNPYAHFSTPGQGCYSMLFDFASIDDEWQPVEGFDVI